MKLNITLRDFNEYIANSYKQYNTYKILMEKEVSREMARIGLPLNMYAEFYWCINSL